MTSLAPPRANLRRPWLAVLLSLVIVGLGQVYCGRIARGLFLFLIGNVLGVVFTATVLLKQTFWSPYVLIAWFLMLNAVWLYAVFDAWLMALPVGFLITAILVANNIRDIDTDSTAGKRTLAVMIGRPASRVLYAGLLWGAFGLTAVFAVTGLVPGGAALTLLAAPLTVPLVRRVHREEAGPALIGALKGTSRLQALYGALAALGIVVWG